MRHALDPQRLDDLRQRGGGRRARVGMRVAHRDALERGLQGGQMREERGDARGAARAERREVARDQRGAPFRRGRAVS